MSQIAGNIHSRLSRWGFLGVLALLVVLACPAFGQNTKGDRPAVKNQRQVRETNAKAVKKKEKGRTRDIANRRLRTKDKSSASRANASFPRPSPYAGRKSKAERAASPRGRVFSKSPRESNVRAWRGDVSNYPLRRMHPTNADAARSNVYPQKGPYVRYARKQPKAKPPVYTETVKGNPFIRHEPRYEERAWKGSADHGPIRNKSATGKIKNTYSQDSPYVGYYNKRAKAKDKPVSNREEVSRAKRFSRKPLTGGSPAYSPGSASGPFIQRGKKNVYWGKFQKKERGHTGDLTGAPVRTRNYKSIPAGLVGRDTVKFFGRKPQGDRAIRPGGGGYPTATKRGQRGWKGDVAGWPVREREQGKYNRQKALKPTEPGEGAFSLSKVFNWQFRGVKPKHRVPDTREARYQGNIRSEGKVFNDQGAGYSGNIKSQGAAKVFGDQGAGYSGNIRRGTQPGFGRQGAGYSGNIKSQGAAKVFGDQGAGYSGNIKRGRQGFSRLGAGYSGDMRSQGGKDFGDQGEEFTGYLKARKPKKGGGSVSGDLWNNRNTAIASRTPLAEDAKAANYSGTFKLKRPEKGGGSVSGKLWNNQNSAIASRTPLAEDAKAANYSGTFKLKRPEKGGGSVSGKLWNNQNTAIASRTPLAEDAKAANYTGKIVRPRLKKDYVQNPNAYKQSIKKHPPEEATYKVGGLQVKVKEKETKNKPNVKKGVLPGVAPSRSSVKANEYSRNMKVHWDYKHNPNSSKESMRGIPPERGGEKAGNFSGRSKSPSYKHNPSSDDHALKVTLGGKASARANDFQGNSKMHKYKGAKLHPDAQFAHSYRDNVKEERTMLMSVKLLWGKLFRKSETQPSNLKDNSRRPGYDKREKELWNK